MKLMGMTVLGLLTVALSASAQDGGAPNKCVQACNVKYTQPYLDCKETKECQEYVRLQARICIRHCGE